MKVFFTIRGINAVEEREVEALDICTSKWVVGVRASGILVKGKNAQGEWEEADQIDISLDDTHTKEK